jgi:hypothetical protein
MKSNVQKPERVSRLTLEGGFQMKRAIIGLKRAAMIVAFAMLASAGCSTETHPPTLETGSPLAQANFDLQQCEQQEPNLFSGVRPSTKRSVRLSSTATI